eukprot:12048510-Karenia_brevis.AAC.1
MPKEYWTPAALFGFPPSSSPKTSFKQRNHESWYHGVMVTWPKMSKEYRTPTARSEAPLKVP